MFSMRAKMISVGLLGTAALLPLDVAKADQVGHASWYSLPANVTASGERMDPNELTAAHRSLPFGTRVLVQNLTNGRSVVVRINDRGPFIGGRIIDLSKAAAASIGMLGAGTAQVRISTTAPDGGSALAALGEATAKAKKGVALAAKESAAAEPHHAANTAAPARLIEARNRPTKTLKPTAVASLSPVLEEDGTNGSEGRPLDARCRLLFLQAGRSDLGARARGGLGASLCDLREYPGLHAACGVVIANA